MFIAPGMTYRWRNSEYWLLQWKVRRQGNHNSHSALASLKFHLIVHIFSEFYYTVTHYYERYIIARYAENNGDLEPALISYFDTIIFALL